MNKTQKLPNQGKPGLAILITVQKKTLAFEHGEVRTKKVYNLGGLYADEPVVSDSPKEINTKSHLCESVWGENPTDDMKNNFGEMLYALPQVLQKLGLEVMDNKVESFHKSVANIKRELQSKAKNGIIPASMMTKADEIMKKHNLRGYVVKITAIRVSKSNPKGSKLRSDGLYESRQVLRTSMVDRMLTDADFAELSNILLSATLNKLVTEMELTTGYTITKNNNGGVLFTPVRKVTGKYGDLAVGTQFSTPPGVKTR